MLMTFLFWNICRRPLENVIANLARLHEIDAIMLAESWIQPATLLNALNTAEKSDYHYVPSVACTRIEIFTRFPAGFFPAVYEEDKMAIRSLRLPGLTEILVAVPPFSK